MNKISLLFAAALLVGCAAAPLRDSRDIAAEANEVFGTDQFSFVEIRSQGRWHTLLTRLHLQQDEAMLLRQELRALSDAGGGRIAISGDDPGLTRVVLGQAIAGQRFPDVSLVYAGDEAGAALLEPRVREAGMRFGFVDAAHARPSAQ